MQIVKLNCTSCGAPINIPENIDSLVCTSCGSKLAVDRGDGYVTLQLVEKVTQAIQESGEKSHSAIKENTFVTKVELKRVQISQSINTEEMKLNSLRQEIRGLARKPQLLPVEVQQLASLRIDEVNGLQHIRRLNMDSAKLEEGWEESLEVFLADLHALEEIIQTMVPYGNTYPYSAKLDELNRERNKCIQHLEALETRLLTRQLKSLRYAAIPSLSVEELEKMQQDIQSDMDILICDPPSVVKSRIRDQVNGLANTWNAVYPRKKVESDTGELKSLDLNPPYSEIPWELIPLVELAESDLQKIDKSPDNPSKFLIREQIEIKLKQIKSLQAMDLPSQRLLAERQRKKNKKITCFVFLGIFGVIALIILIAIISSAVNRSKSSVTTPGTRNTNTPQSASTINESPASQNLKYEQITQTFFEITVSVTYLRSEPNFECQELDKLKRGDLLLNTGAVSDEPGWYHVQLLSDDTKVGYLYKEWISPIRGRSINAQKLTFTGLPYYSEDFAGDSTAWLSETFNDDFGVGGYQVVNDIYQMDLNANDSGYVYSSIDVENMPDFYLYLADMKQKSAIDASAGGLLFNYRDQDNFDFFLMTGDGDLIVGSLRNSVPEVFYDTTVHPNPNIQVDPKGHNILFVLVEKGDDNNPSKYTFGVNEVKAYELEYEKVQPLEPTIGLITWSITDHQPISYQFDSIEVMTP